MKKILLLVSCFSILSHVQAQKDDKPAFDQSVAVKWSPASIFFGKIGLGAEYNFKRKASVTFNVGVPFEKETTFEIDNEDRNLSTKTFSIMAGYRMYLGKKPVKGFYIEPYLKYLDNKSITNTDFDIGLTNRPFLVTSEYSGIGIGAQLGVQFLIAKRVVIDWYLLGPEANISKHDLLAQETGNGLPWTNAEAQDAEDEINDFVNDIPLLKNNLDVTVNAAAKNVKTHYKGFLPGIRSGISIGIRF
ncbi:MAG TPA: DUF3575 domain-containing protein [Chitinophagaceae bacterium]